MKVLERILTTEGVQALLDICIGPELDSRGKERTAQESVSKERVVERGALQKQFHRTTNPSDSLRAGLRTDQGIAHFSPLQHAWQTGCSPRMGTGARGQQHDEAVPGRWGFGNGTNGEKMECHPKLHRRLVISCQQNYCLRATVPKSALKPLDRPWQKALCPTHS